MLAKADDWDWIPPENDFPLGTEVDDRSSTGVFGCNQESVTIRCTGRGKVPNKPPSILSIKLPPPVVQAMDHTRKKGRGRARIFKKIDTISTIASKQATVSVGHGKPLTSTGTLSEVTASGPVGEGSKKPALEDVLASANERFKSYGCLKHHPARKSSSDVDITNIEEFPCLPSQKFEKHSQKQTDDETQLQPEDNVFQSPQEYCEKDESSQKAEDEESKPELESLVEASRQQSGIVDKNLCNSVIYPNSLRFDVDELMESTPKKLNNQVDMVNVIGDLSSESQHSGYLVRLENLPTDIKQSELEEYIATYGHVLDVNLELRIKDGEEKLAAEIRLSDASIADFVVSCLDGAETIFEGIHDPIKCFLK